jgi:NAD(P)-dependent dehydrogenase (short-subunit alcohol dehydrogenase family)
MANRFDGKVVLLMGAGSGQGRVAGQLYAQEGATVVMADVSPAVEEAFQEISSGNGTRGFSAITDITNKDQVKELADRTVEEFGKIDAAVAFSGVVQDAGQITELPEEEWDRVLTINLKGHFFFAKAVAPHMQRQKSGRIVLIASFWGRKGYAYYAAYCASKAGVISLAQTLAEEMAPYDVTVNSVAPGMIETAMHQKALHEEAEKRGVSYEEFRDSEWAKIPLGKAGDPEDIVHAVMFLTSDEAKYITGASLDVNGGVQLR